MPWIMPDVFDHACIILQHFSAAPYCRKPNPVIRAAGRKNPTIFGNCLLLSGGPPGCSLHMVYIKETAKSQASLQGAGLCMKSGGFPHNPGKIPQEMIEIGKEFRKLLDFLPEFLKNPILFHNISGLFLAGYAIIPLSKEANALPVCVSLGIHTIFYPLNREVRPPLSLTFRVFRRIMNTTASLSEFQVFVYS